MVQLRDTGACLATEIFLLWHFGRFEINTWHPSLLFMATLARSPILSWANRVPFVLGVTLGLYNSWRYFSLFQPPEIFAILGHCPPSLGRNGRLPETAQISPRPLSQMGQEMEGIGIYFPPNTNILHCVVGPNASDTLCFSLA